MEVLIQWKLSSGSWGAAQKMDRRSPHRWVRRPGPVHVPDWAKNLTKVNPEALEKGTHPRNHQVGGLPWARYSVDELNQQAKAGDRPYPAKIRTSPTRLLIIQRRTESCTSGSLVSRPTGVADGLSGPSAPELVTPERPVRALGTWARRTRAPRLWHGDPCQVRQI